MPCGNIGMLADIKHCQSGPSHRPQELLDAILKESRTVNACIPQNVQY